MHWILFMKMTDINNFWIIFNISKKLAFEIKNQQQNHAKLQTFS